MWNLLQACFFIMWLGAWILAMERKRHYEGRVAELEASIAGRMAVENRIDAAEARIVHRESELLEQLARLERIQSLIKCYAEFFEHVERTY